MTDLERKAVQRVFELLEIAQGDLRDATEILRQALRQAIRQALAQPEQEPVAWMCEDPHHIGQCTTIYTAPVDAVNMTQERVDETTKREHEPMGYVIRMTGQYHTGDFCGEFQSRTALKQGQVLYTEPPKREHLERLCRIMGTFDLATGHADTMEQALDALESELRDVLGYLRAKREWVGLTDEEFEQAVDGLEDLKDCWIQIEAKLKEKNK